LSQSLLETAESLENLSAYRDEVFVAAFLGVKRQTVRGCRKKRCGPRWYRINGRLIRYRINEVIRWANSQPGGQAA
jgi:hypothetical protein